MYCMNCGTKLGEGVKFCPECGTATGASGGTLAPAPAAPAAPKKAKKRSGAGKKLLIALLVIVIIAALLVAAYFICLKIVNSNELKLPDPRTYFGLEYSEVDLDSYFDSYYFITTEDPMPMLRSYADLLDRSYGMDMEREGAYRKGDNSYYYNLEQEYPSVLTEIMDELSAEVRLPEIGIIYLGTDDSGRHKIRIDIIGNVEFIPAEVYGK